MLTIDNLTVEAANNPEKQILNDLSLYVPEGEIHVLFGPNGSGKTTLLQTIIGFPQYKIRSGSIRYKDKDITKMSITERARLGITLRNALMFFIFSDPASLRVTLYSDFFSSAGAAAAAGAAGPDATGIAAETPNLSSRALTKSDNSRTDIFPISSISLSNEFDAMIFPIQTY